MMSKGQVTKMQYWTHKVPALLVALLIGMDLSCGVKGPPKPPELPAPEAPEKFGLRLREGCVELVWVAPKAQEPDQVPATRWEVLRAPQPEPGQMPAFRIINRTTDTAYLDCSLALGDKVVYTVRGISEEARRGKDAPLISAANLDPPLAPRNPQISAGDGFIELSWTRSPDMPETTGVNIYRAEDPALLPWRPINPQPVIAANYADGPLENGVRYFYEIRAVVPVPEGIPVEGPAAPLVSAVPADKVPPSPPRGFTAVWTQAGVTLHWLRNQEPDLKGYMIYRRMRGVGEFKELFLEPMSDTAFLDTTARRGVEYEYMVSAVDHAEPPNISPPSDIQVVYSEP